MQSNASLVVRILDDLIIKDDFGRITDKSQKLGANGMVEFLASSFNSNPDPQAQVLNTLYGMHRRRLIDLTLDSNGELSTVCICPAGINLYRQLEVC